MLGALLFCPLDEKVDKISQEREATFVLHRDWFPKLISLFVANSRCLDVYDIPRSSDKL
uniref:Uncharacterized protein n=1 Tax=Lepeophtheirus salmonis TaxID=72036 RepID=A0A0K2VCH7_LEPSM